MLECAADGSFDLENVADVDLDRAPSPAKPSPPSPPPPATTSASSSAAAHTYDKGYKRWEDFDADGAALEAESPFKVSFALGSAAPADLRVPLLWVAHDGAEHLINTLDAANRAVDVTTFPGHRFAVRPTDGSDPTLLTMSPAIPAYSFFND